MHEINISEYSPHLLPFNMSKVPNKSFAFGGKQPLTGKVSVSTLSKDVCVVKTHLLILNDIGNEAYKLPHVRDAAWLAVS